MKTTPSERDGLRESFADLEWVGGEVVLDGDLLRRLLDDLERAEDRLRVPEIVGYEEMAARFAGSLEECRGRLRETERERDEALTLKREWVEANKAAGLEYGESLREAEAEIARLNGELERAARPARGNVERGNGDGAMIASTKHCNGCGQDKSLDEFHANKRAHDGKASCCKPCRAAKAKAYRAANAEKVSQGNADWVRRNLAKVRSYEKRWRQENRERCTESAYRWKQRNPEKRRAHGALHKAVRAGRVHKPACCEECGVRAGAAAPLHGHHEDYARPLVVDWLCVACHKRRHRKDAFENIEDFGVET